MAQLCRMIRSSPLVNPSKNLTGAFIPAGYVRGKLKVRNRKYVGFTIMLVEDSVDTRYVLSLYLQEQGYSVVTAENGEVAVEVARKNCPDLILMDLNMPLMDGLAATEQIRECQDLCKDVPILALTAYDTYGMKDAALEAGCNGYITKPMDFERLNNIVSRVLYCSTPE